MQKIYGLLSDDGDGSASIHWFKSYELCEKLMEEDPERWYMNEDSPCESLTFPDELNLDECGFDFSVEKSFRTRREAQQYINQELSDIDPDLIDIQYSYLDIDNQFQNSLINLIYETFEDGFFSPNTYNDTLLNSCEEEFEKQKKYYQEKIESLLKTYLGNK